MDREELLSFKMVVVEAIVVGIEEAVVVVVGVTVKITLELMPTADHSNVLLMRSQ